MNASLMNVRDLSVQFETRRGIVRAVDDVSFTQGAGERFGLAGESGCGKSTLLLAILGLIDEPGRIAQGQILLDGRDLTRLTGPQFRALRLKEIAWIPQGAMNALNPVMRVGEQIALAIRAHGHSSAGRRQSDFIAGLLRWVDLVPEVARRYPHELSGGMKQRVCVAMAISLRPRLILADEPTSALDVVVQRRIMQTLHQLQQRTGTAILLVGHDMGLMAQFTQRVGIMYAGRMVEVGPTEELFAHPLHPYTRLLIASVPTFQAKGGFTGIPGSAPSLLEPPAGCPFRPRCPDAKAECGRVMPDLKEVSPGRQVACLLYEGEAYGPVT